MNTNSTFQKLTVVFLLVTFLAGFNGTANAQGALKATGTFKSYNGAPESCYGANDGQLTITASGGAGGYTYSINNGGTFVSNSVFSNLKTGQNYVVVVMDKTGAKTEAQWLWLGKVDNPITLQLNYISPVTCSNATGGYIESGAWGGTGNITFSIDNGATFQSSGTFNNLPSGIYNIIARDANGCNSVVKTATIGGSFTAKVYGDTTVEANATAYVKIFITNYSGNPASTLYTAKGVDNFGISYTESNLKVGENLIAVKPTQNITYTIQSIEMQNGTKCKGYATGTMTITVNSKFVWAGKNTNWNDAANWSKKAVPAANSEVVIPVSKSNPVITGNAYAKNISIDKGGSIQILGTLHLSETITGDKKSVDATTGTIDFCGTSTQTFNSGILVGFGINNMLIGNAVNLSDSLNVYGNVSFNGTNKTFNSNDLMTLKATAAQTAGIGQIIDGNQINGKVTVEQYLPARKGWKFLSIPTMPGQSIKDAWQEGQATGNTTGIKGYGVQLTGEMNDWAAKGFDRKSVSPSIKTYDVNNNYWVGVPSTLQSFNNPSNAYMVFVRGDRSADATNSPETVTVLRTKGELTQGDQKKITIPADKFVAIGNPYAAPLDLGNIKTDANMFFYVWDQNLGNSYGAYQTFMRIKKGVYMAIPGGGTYTTLSQNVIPAGQAFFAYNADGGTVKINESSKADMNSFSNNSRVMSDDSDVITDQLNVKLYSVSAAGSLLVDGIFQNFSQEFSNAIDGYDAMKSVNSTENLSVKTAGKLLAIESRSFSENTDTTILNVTGLSYTTYRLDLEFSQAIPDRDAVLIDKYTGKKTTLNTNGKTSYEFQVINNANSYAANRFTVIYVPQRPLPVTFTSVKAEKKQEAVNISWSVENQVNVASYIIERSNDGASFSQIGNVGSANMTTYNFSDVRPLTGVNYYRVVSVDIDGKKGYTSVVKASMNQVNDVMSVYPNPIVGNNVHLEMKVQAKGMYYISIRNQMGQVVDGRQIDFNGSKTGFDVTPSTKLISGVYTIDITHPSGDHSVVRFVK